MGTHSAPCCAHFAFRNEVCANHHSARRYLPQSGQLKFGQNIRAAFDRNGAVTGRVRSNCPQSCNNIHPKSATSAKIWPGSAKFGPEAAKFSQHWANLGRDVWPGFDRNWFVNDRHSRGSGQIRLQIGRVWPELGQVCPSATVDQPSGGDDQNWPRDGRLCEFGQMRATQGGGTTLGRPMALLPIGSHKSEAMLSLSKDGSAGLAPKSTQGQACVRGVEPLDAYVKT